VLIVDNEKIKTKENIKKKSLTKRVKESL